jgi:N-methylhydantoinase A/oxoprolinase/acetone carboxylase beta subunit
MSRHPAGLRIGVDTGGTFTDLVALDAAGRIVVHKLRSTPAEPAQAILEGIRFLTEAPPDRSPADRERPGAEITHGSTVATNAVLERKGARVALITTAGFEDVLRIGRQTRPELYNFMVQARRPLIEPGMTFGVKERITADAAVLEPLEECSGLMAALQKVNADSVAVCLLHSYANPAHERQLADALLAAGFRVSASHEILPEYREFERWATTVINAYVTPLMANYLTKLEAGLEGSAGAGASLRIMQSNGGSISAVRAKEAAVQTILSGPAAGVVGAQAVAAASGYTRLVTFDMGGTSTDVSLIDGAIGATNDSLVGDLPVRLPVLDIHTVGAGGGSIAFIDSGGSLRVGPRSAGADPGPACYGKGSQLTVTDANLLLGRLDPAYFLGGRMPLDLTRARRIAQELGRYLKLSERAVAEGVVRIANANMERAIRVVSVERGHDPRDFALLAFGGAGGLHACALADSLEIDTILIPEHSGVLSALGMLLADVAKDYSVSILQSVEAGTVNEAGLQAKLAPLLQRARGDLRAEGFSDGDITLQASLDMRYKGQAYEIPVPLTAEFASDFHARHAKLYGYANPLRPTEVVQLRLKAVGHTQKPKFADPSIEPAPLPEPDAMRLVTFGRRAVPTPVYHRDRLHAGMHGQGPAIVISGQSTNLIQSGYRWRIDGCGMLIATRLPRQKGSR